jgi:hypothetical protein
MNNFYGPTFGALPILDHAARAAAPLTVVPTENQIRTY